MVAVGAEETRYGEWSVIRFRSAGHGTANNLSTNFFYGGKSKLDENGDSVPRQLVLTKVSLVERRPDNYEVIIYHGQDLEKLRQCQGSYYDGFGFYVDAGSHC